LKKKYLKGEYAKFEPPYLSKFKKADKTKENASCNVLQTYEYKLKGLYTKSATLLNILDTLHSKICDMFSIVCVMMPHVGKPF